MLGLLKKSTNGNGLDGYHRFTPEELTQVKMLDLRQIMKDKGVKLSWANNQYESQCPFHEDKMRSPRLQMNQKDGVWLWKCDGGHHGGTIIDFIEEAHGVPFPRAVEYLRQLICPMPKLNGNGLTIKEILEPLKQLEVRGSTPSHPTGQELEAEAERPLEAQSSKLEAEAKTKQKAKTEEVFTSHLQPRASSPSQSLEHHTSSLVERSEDQATFKYGDLIYHVKDLKNTSKHSLRIILKLNYKDGHFTDRVDLHSARARRSFSNQAAERLNLQSAQIEEHLESLMESLEQELLPRASSFEPRAEMSEEEKSQALDLLRDPELLDRMASDLDRLGYVGESTNKKILYLVGTSRLLDKPISAIVRSGSGAGKSALMEQVLSLMPEEDVLFFSRITPQSLFYMGREALDRKILAIDEREGSQSADYSIRTLQSRGKLTLAASSKDPKSGEWKTLVREFVARTPYMESSTKEKLNEENLNRCFELYLDESPEQTQRILESQRKQASGIDLLNEEEKTKLLRTYQNAQKLLKPIEVRIPYELEIELPKHWIRSRRDHERFLSLVKGITLLRQHQKKSEDRTQKSDHLSSDVCRLTSQIEATKEDYKKAEELVQTIFGNLFCELPKPLSEFFNLLKKKVEENTKEISIEDFEFTRRQVRAWTGLPDHIVKRSMKALEDLEYMEVKKSTRGGKYIYRIS